MTTTLRRTPFIQELQGKVLDVAALRAKLKTVAVASADLDGDGKIRTPEELNKLFTALDALDNDGDRNSMLVHNGSTLTRAGDAVDALRAFAASAPGTPSPLKDIALARVFPTLPTVPLQRGARGPQVTAVQWALTRLGLLSTRVDVTFGGDTLKALQKFNGSSQIDAATLQALDAAVATLDPRSPAEQSGNLWAVLDDFSTLTPLRITQTSGKLTWSNPEIALAFRTFCGEIWPRMKENKLEMDCKTVSLFFVAQFRKMVKAQTGMSLPMPTSPDGRSSLPDPPWEAYTRGKAGSYFQRLDARTSTQVRNGYDSVKLVEALDPTASMIFGVNLRNINISAHTVSTIARPIGRTMPDNKGDTRKAEVDVDALEVGDMLLLNHNKQAAGTTTPDRVFDHCVSVVGVERDANGRTTKLVLGVGSFDDVKDNDGTTPANGLPDINTYMEEVTVSFDQNGLITGSETTWTSEPLGLVAPRYSHTNTLMELNAGGQIFAGRFLS